MRKPVLNVNIDRIVLSGLDLDPSITDSLRLSISSELKKIIAENGVAEGTTSRGVPRVSVPIVNASGLSEGQVAMNVAKSIYGAISSRKR